MPEKKRSFFPWRYLVPRRRYFRSAAIARACPEIAWHIDRAAVYTAMDGVMLAVSGVALVITAPFWLLAVLIIEMWSRTPDYAERRNKVIEEAHALVPLEEIRRRIGLDTAVLVATRTHAEGGTVHAKPVRQEASGDE